MKTNKTTKQQKQTLRTIAGLATMSVFAFALFLSLQPKSAEAYVPQRIDGTQNTGTTIGYRPPGYRPNLCVFKYVRCP